MKQNFLNKVKVYGKVYEHNLAVKTTGAASKNPGTEYIGGTLDIATDDDCLNVVTVNFTYVTPTTKSGGENKTYTALKKIIDEGKTVVLDGKDAATCVKADTNIALNDFYTERAITDTNPEGLVSSKRCEGGFLSIVNKVAGEASFEVDMVINNTVLVEADEERNIKEDFLRVKGAVFNFRKDILPIEFIVRNPGGIKYFESLDASSKNVVFTKVWGNIKSQTIVTKKEEETAFGEAAVTEYTRTVREWELIKAAKEPYEFDSEETITSAELGEAIQKRNEYLADAKRRQEEYQAKKDAAPAAASAPVSASNGGFNF